MEIIKKTTESIVPELVELRHRLHSAPELGLHEFNTAEIIKTELKKIPGITIKSGIATTGMVATLFPDKTGPCIAMRSEMDALPVLEMTGLPYASENKGVMHACGHDGHMSCLVGAARVLSHMKDSLSGPVKLFFQPAEEYPGGAAKMIEAGVLDDPPVPKAIFDFHNWPGLPFGCACFKNGAIMASTDAVDIVVRGKSSHAALPHKGADSIVAASAIVAALQTIISRRISPSHPAVVTIGEIHGGSARNVIPSEVRLSGTIRMTDPAVRDTAYAALREITESTAIAYGARAEVKITPGYPITINNPDVMIIAMNAIRAELGESSVIDNMDQCLAGEDFSFFSEKIPATMFLLGTTKPGEDFVPLHNARFNFNDELIPYAVRAYCACVIEAQNKMR